MITVLTGIFIPLFAILLAEFGDKTQLAIICLSSKTKEHFKLLAGVFLAFVFADGLAIVFGNILANIVPMEYIKAGAGLLFIAFGIIAVLQKEDGDKECSLKKPFFSGFGLVFLMEMGDKTQIVSGLFALRYNPLLVFAGVIMALTILSVAAIYTGKLLKKKLNRKTISFVSGIIFILIGVSSFF